MSLTITRSYSDGNALTEAQLDAIASSVEALLNVTKLDATYFNADVCNSSTLASNSIATAALTDDCVNANKLSGSPSVDADRAVDTDHIRDSAITTAKILDDSITYKKIFKRSVTTDNGATSAGNVSMSITSGTFTTTSTSYTDLTGAASVVLTCNLTTLGGAVMVRLVPDGTSNGAVFKRDGSANNSQLTIKIKRDSTTIAEYMINAFGAQQSSVCSGVMILDTPAAGTYAYTVQIKTSSGSGTAYCQYVRLMAYEVL